MGGRGRIMRHSVNHARTPRVRTCEGRMNARLVIACCFIMAAVDIGFAQWIRYRDPRIPRTADGQPELKAPPPHLSDGRIDLSGGGQAGPKATAGAPPIGQTLGEDPVIRLRTADGSPFPLLPAAEAEYQQRMRRGEQGPAGGVLPPPTR